MARNNSPAIVTVFRSRLRADADAIGYHAVADEMERQARNMPGFVDFKSFTADDGERVSIAVFDSIDHHDRWRDHPDHRAAQQRGRDEFYSEYRIMVGEVFVDHTFPSGTQTRSRRRAP